jgi:ATP-dependent Clp protease ATP-binding subunit ClpX
MEQLRVNGNAYATKQPPTHCGICNKNHFDVIALIAGPKCAICNECFDLCTDILQEEEKADAIEKGLAP